MVKHNYEMIEEMVVKYIESIAVSIFKPKEYTTNELFHE